MAPTRETGATTIASTSGELFYPFVRFRVEVRYQVGAEPFKASAYPFLATLSVIFRVSTVQPRVIIINRGEKTIATEPQVILGDSHRGRYQLASWERANLLAASRRLVARVYASFPSSSHAQ